MDNSNNLRENLKKELANYRGSINEIATRRNCSREWVRQVLAGEWNDDQVISIAATVLSERKSIREKALQLVAEVLAA